MRPLELAETALRMRGATFEADGCWTAFEVIENGELGRFLHISVSSGGFILNVHSHP